MNTSDWISESHSCNSDKYIELDWECEELSPSEDNLQLGSGRELPCNADLDLVTKNAYYCHQHILDTGAEILKMA